MRLRQREALFPRMRKTLALRAPGVEELARERGARLDFRDHVVRTEHEGDCAVAGGLLGFALGRCQAAITDRDERALRAAADRIGALQHRRHPARTEPVISDARISAGSCAAAPITAALSFSA